MMEYLTYRKIKKMLEEAGIEDAGYEAEELILRFCPDTDRASLLFGRDEPLCSEELSVAVKKRCERYPLQYIIGSWGFCNETYRVSPECLIPRPETEQLVELAAKLLPPNARFLDLCTGSGCIAVSTLAARQDCTCIAADLYDGPLCISAQNAKDNGVAERFCAVRCDVLKKEDAENICGQTEFAALISNPPYIKSEDMKALAPELSAEPRQALDGGGDGLMFYRAILDNFSGYIAADGFILFEAGHDTAAEVARLGESAGFFARVIKDLSGLDRTVLLTRKNQETYNI